MSRYQTGDKHEKGNNRERDAKISTEMAKREDEDHTCSHCYAVKNSVEFSVGHQAVLYCSKIGVGSKSAIEIFHQLTASER